jgi:PAS domain S-box-containing protein
VKYKIDYPFLYPITWLAPYGFMLGALLGLVVSIGMILVYFQRTTNVFFSVSQRLRESEEQMCSIMASMNEGVVLQNADGKIVFSNNKALQIFKMTAEEMIGKSSLSEEFHMVNEDNTPYPVERRPATITLRTGQPQINRVMGITELEKETTWISVNTEPMFHTGDTKPYSVVVTFRDITQQKHTADLTKQLLAFARRGKYRSVPVDLNEVIEEVSMLLKHSIDKRIKFRQNLNTQDAITIGDPS